MAIGKRMGSKKNAEQAVKRSSGSGDGYITRIPDGTSSYRFLDEPEDFFGYMRYYREDDRTYVPLGDDERAPDGARTQKRYVCNAVAIDDDKVVVLDVPTALFKSLLNKHTKYDTLTDRDYEIDRSGEGYDITYDVTPESPSNRKLSKYEKKDLGEWLEAARDYALAKADEGDDEDEDDKPSRSSRKGGSAPKGRARAAKEEDEDESEEINPVQLKKLGRAADKGNDDAEEELTGVAAQFDLDPDDYETWIELVDAIIAAAEGGEDEDGEEEADEEAEEEDGDDEGLDIAALKVMARKADKDDEDSIESLTSIAADYGVDPDDYEKWTEVVTAIAAATEGGEEGEDEEAEGGDDEEEIEVDLDALPDMEIDELREIASSLDIATARMTKVKLIKAITEALED